MAFGSSRNRARHESSKKYRKVTGSLVFLLGTRVRLATPRGAAEALANGGQALVSNREDPMFRQALSARGLIAQPVGSVPGFDYSNGQRMVLTLYQVAPG